MSAVGKPTLFFLFHCNEPNEGLETLYFFKAFDPEIDLEIEQPTNSNVTKLIGPTTSEECLTVAKCIKAVAAQLGMNIFEEHGADD